MTGEHKSISRAHLHAFVDRELKQQRHADVVDFLKTHPDLSRHVRDYAEINSKLHQLFDDVLEEPLPDPLRDKIRGTVESSKPATKKNRRVPNVENKGRSQQVNVGISGIKSRFKRYSKMRGKLTFVLLGMVLGGVIGVSLHQSDAEIVNAARTLITDLLSEIL